MGRLLLGLFAAGGLLLGGCAPSAAPVSVLAAAETTPVASPDDAADDPAIWVAPDPAKSLIVATDKKAGLLVYGLDGVARSGLALGRINNVDLRMVTIGGKSVVLAAGTNRTDSTLALARLDPETGTLTADPGSGIALGLEEPYGLCLYKSGDGRLFVFATDKDGDVAQLEIALSAERLSAREVRRFSLGSVAEGCVADDRTGTLYIAEEDRGIWRFAAGPTAPTRGVLAAKVDGRRLSADVEGLAIVADGAREGWLVASSQGDSAFAVYSLPSMGFMGRFRIARGDDIDAVSETDGIAAAAAALPGFPQGLLVVQDGENDGALQNFKLVSWAEVQRALKLK